MEFKNAEQDRVINGNGQSKEFIIKRLRRITRNLFQIGSLEHFQFGPFLGHFQLGPIMGHFQPIKLDFIYHSKSPIHICSFIISPLSWNHRSFIITNPFLFLYFSVCLPCGVSAHSVGIMYHSKSSIHFCSLIALPISMNIGKSNRIDKVNPSPIYVKDK